jgi:DNA polymerase III sliding clamp (beta) subunit (PCNA family)
MADNSELLYLPQPASSLMIRSGAQFSLIARGRREAAALVISIHQGPTFITARVLHELITRTIFAVSDDERRQNLNLALLIFRPTSLTMVATDGHRLSFVERTNERTSGVRDDKQVLIPLLPLRELHQLLLDPSVESVLFVEDNDTFSFHVGQRTISWVKPTEKFPDYESVMTKEMQNLAKFVVVRADELSAAIQNVAQPVFSRNAIRLQFEQNILRITGITDFVGEYEETIRTLYTDDAVESAFCDRYIQEFLIALDNQGDVRLNFKDAKSALEISPKSQDDGYSWRYLLMPMQRIGPARWPLPTDFATSVSARVFLSLITGYNFDKLSRYESSLLVIEAGSLAVVIRDGQRLFLREAKLESEDAKSNEQRILISHEIMSEIQRIVLESDAENVEFAENDDGVRFRIGNRSHAWQKRSEDDRENDAAMPPTEFVISFSSRSLKALIDRTIFATSKEESRYAPSGVLLVLKSDTLAMVATDGHRLSFAEKANDLADGVVAEKRILIAREVLLEIMQLLSVSQTHKVELAENEGAYSCRIGGQILSWVKPTDKFSDYEAVLLDEKAMIAVVQADELRDAILYVCGPVGWNQEQNFAMIVKQGEVKISFESAKGEKREKSIGALYAGELLAIGLSAPYILDFLDALGGAQSVRLAFKDGQSAMEMRPDCFDPNYRWRYLVMPRKSS